MGKDLNQPVYKKKIDILLSYVADKVEETIGNQNLAEKQKKNDFWRVYLTMINREQYLLLNMPIMRGN